LNGIKINGWVMLLALAGLGMIASNLFRTTAMPAGQLPNGQMINAKNQGITATQTPSAGLAVTGNSKASDALLPTELERMLITTDFSVGKRNPFVAVPPAPQIVKKVAVVPTPPPQPIIQAAPQPPMMPPLNLKFVGRVTEPNGNRVVFASLNENPVSLNVGQTLPNGFRVDAIKDDAVELTYTLLGTTTRFDLPKPPTFDIR
jgi:hypothetical protein